MDVAQAELAAGTITSHTYRERQEDTHAAECSWRWGHDIWTGQDRDRYGHFTGSGTAKIRCADCRRKVPPQDVVFDPVADGPVCTDCRTRAPRPPRVRIGCKSDVRRLSTYERDENGEWVTVEDLVQDPAADSSPTTAALDAMADSRARVEEDRLPAEDEAELLDGLAAFQAAGGDLRAFSDATGETAADAVQRQRQQKNAEM